MNEELIGEAAVDVAVKTRRDIVKQYACFQTPPTILSHPKPTNVVAAIGGGAWFRVQAAGFPPLHYQWYVGSAAIPGATNTTLHLENLTAAQSGVYKVSVSNQAGTT